MNKINWEKLTCIEASTLSMGHYIPCDREGYAIVFHHRDRTAYVMCDSCTSHNVHNRGGIILAERNK